MSRNEKLFQRLDELEGEYRELAAREFAMWVENQWHGRYSLFLTEKIPFLHFFKYPSPAARERADNILRIEKEIEMLRQKLDQPMSESPVHAVRDAAARICAAHESGVATERMIAKTLLKDLGDDESAQERP